MMLIKCIRGRSWNLALLRVPKINNQSNSWVKTRSNWLLPGRYVSQCSRLHCNTSKVTVYSRPFSTGRSEIEGSLTTQNFDPISDDTIDSLAEYFDELLENCPHIKDYDVNYGDGVLTVKFGDPYGTYVINRQTPNQQIWLSSPTSGPKRYDFDHGQWIYRHDGITLHQLLDREIGNIVNSDVHFSKCAYSGTQHNAQEDKKK